MIDRLEELPECYRPLNVAEILNRIDDINNKLMMHPELDIDEWLGEIEEVLDLVRVLRAHLGLPAAEEKYLP